LFGGNPDRKSIGIKMRIFSKSISLIFLFSFFTLTAGGIPDIKTSVEVKTIFGRIKLQDELLRVYNLEHMQRLKGIDQSGTPAYWNGVPKFSRLEHSLDVLWLVLNFGGDLKEQIAAFCHDISHTVFSHVADIVFGVANYQDTIHEWFLQQTKIAEIIRGYDWVEKDILPDNPDFKRLEQPLPDMCADRIAYNIHTAFVFRMINQEDIDFIVNKLRFDDEKKRWYFTSKKAAKKFASLSLAFTEHFWGSADNMVVYFITSKILKRAFLLERITKDDMHFGTDKQVLDKLDNPEICDDPEIKRLIGKAKIPKTAYRILEDDEGTPDFVPKPKFRGIDPWVYNQHSQEYKRLSELDQEFAAEFKRIEEFCKKGCKIQLNIK
jgi:HD superfamily phosphohydrolase